jgi:hypothetical protein
MTVSEKCTLKVLRPAGNPQCGNPGNPGNPRKWPEFDGNGFSRPHGQQSSAAAAAAQGAAVSRQTTHVRHSDAETSEWTPGTAASVVTVWNVEWRHCHTINVNLIINNCIIIIL